MYCSGVFCQTVNFSADACGLKASSLANNVSYSLARALSAFDQLSETPTRSKAMEKVRTAALKAGGHSECSPVTQPAKSEPIAGELQARATTARLSFGMKGIRPLASSVYAVKLGREILIKAVPAKRGKNDNLMWDKVDVATR